MSFRKILAAGALCTVAISGILSTTPAMAAAPATSAMQAADASTNAIPAPVVVTEAVAFTDANGAKRYAYTVKGTPGATVQHAITNVAWTHLGVIGNGRTTTFISALGTDSTSMDFRQQVNGEFSPYTRVQASAIAKRLPLLTVKSATRVTAADGSYSFRYEVEGVAGASVQNGDPGDPWVSIGTIGANGTAVIDSPRGPLSGYFEFRQVLGNQESQKTYLQADDLIVPVALPSVTAEGEAGANTNEVSIEHPAGSNNGIMTVIAPPGTTIAGARSNIGANATINADGSAATFAKGTWTAGSKLWVTLKIKPGQTGTLLGGAMNITNDSGRLLAQGALSARIATDDVTITSPGQGATVGAKPTFTGKGEAGETVKVTSATGRVIAEGTVGNDNNWSAPSVIDLPNGDYTFTATQVVDGKTTTAQVTFKVKAEIPVATDVKFTSPTDGETLNTKRPVFTGTGAPGASIRVHGTTRTIAPEVRVDEHGNWTTTASMDLQGDFRVWVEQTPDNGAAKSSDEVLFHARYMAADAVVVTSPADDSTIGSGYVTFTGTGDEGADIVIEGTTKQIASTTVDSLGNWTVRSDMELPKGDYRFTVKQDATNGDLTSTTVLFHTK
jgi:hypothetical protein